MFGICHAKLYLKMKNEMKFSTTNITTDTTAHKMHDCPHCRCSSPVSRPHSPLYHPLSPRSPTQIHNNIYFNRGNIGSRSPSSNRSFTPERRSPSRPISPRVTIRYVSPPTSRQIISHNRPEMMSSHEMLSSVFSFGGQQEPKKPNILVRNRRKNQQKQQFLQQKSRYHVISQYKSLEEDNELAKTIVQQLQLNYDYFSAQDISDISADVSL